MTVNIYYLRNVFSMTARNTNDPKDPDQKKETQEDNFLKFLTEKLGSGFITAVPRPNRPDPGVEDEVRREEQEKIRKALDFNLTPKEVKEHLDRFVIGQEAAKKILSVAVCDHYNHVRHYHENPQPDREYVKQNIILLGPTGVGKTYLIRNLANLIGVPFVKADITKFSETGYVGGDVDDLVRELVRAADGHMELAEYGIVFLDEIDKISASAEAISRDVSGRGVQTGLLKLLEETEVPRRSPMDMTGQLQEMMEIQHGQKKKRTINTRHILFVVSGAFTNLGDIIRKRMNEGRVGFHSPDSTLEILESEGNILSEAKTPDFISYGFEPEFIGRLPVRVALDVLTEENLFNILKHSEGSILHQYRESFEGYGIKVAFADEALRAVATHAQEEKTGARGLVTVLEEALREFKFELPGGQVKSLAVSEELINDPARVLKNIQCNPEYGSECFAEAQVREFESEFEREYGHRITFDSDAVKKAVASARNAGESISDYLTSKLADYSYGLNLIGKKTGENDFLITADMLERPVEALEEWIRDALGTPPA